MKEQTIREKAWDDLTAAARNFADAGGQPEELVHTMIEFATVLAMNSCEDSRTAHNLIAQAIDFGRSGYHAIKDKEDNKPQDSDIVLAIHPETSDETLARAKKHLASIYPNSAFVMSDNVTLGDDYLKRGVHAMTPIVDGECGVMDFDEHGNLVEEDNTQ